MSAVSLLSSLREKPSDDSLHDGSKEEGDDDCVGGGGGGDPAVLAVGPARRPLQYTREDLLRLRNSPLAKRALDSTEALALVLKKRPDSPNDDDRGARGDAPNENHKGVYGRDRDRDRRSADPRERVRKESEPSSGIVLSPQRRSFTSGCGAPAEPRPAPPLPRTRPESPLSPAAAAPPQKTEQAGRRIGSGRIMVRDVSSAPWERAPPEEAEGREREPYRAPAQPYRPDERPQRANNERYERRSYGRDSFTSDMKREREERFNNDKRERDENRRSGGGRYRRYDKDEEPEWFSGGPTSQNDTIELRGFDEPAKRNGNANAKETESTVPAESVRTCYFATVHSLLQYGVELWARAAEWERVFRMQKRAKWSSKESGSRSPPPGRRPAVPSPPPATDTDVSDTSNEKDSGVESKAEEQTVASDEQQPDFNLDEFLQFDSIPDVLTNGGGEAEGSRFSRWFRRESPTNEHNRHFERRLHSMVDDLDNSSHAAAAAASAGVFAPISPALAPPARPPSLLELLRRANVDERAANDMNSVGGKMHSLEELEARLRPQHAAQDHDLSAFKRLLAQVSGGHAVPAAEQQRPPPPQQAPPPPMSLLQMLNKSMEQQQQQQQAQQQQQQQPQPPPHIPQQLLYKLLQVQQQQQPPPPPPPEPRASSADRELLQRPEAQAIIQGLKAGEITVQHLMQQLGNPGLQSRHRELLFTILRIHQQHRQMAGGSPLPGVVGVGPPAAPHLVVPPHHQPLRLSPLPHPGVPARIPSPRELAAHTQSIMQSALIKKKLEEQRENYRRRTEMQPKQPTPISFTPTSVLRKMTAEKESEAPSPKPPQQWTQPPKMPQGRPIVKGNQSGAAPQMGYMPSPADYQQHYLSQQQQMANAIRPFPHPQQRQMPPSQMNNMSSMSNLTRGVASGATLHQLLVQSHQRTLNEMSGGGPVGAGGGDNQLARWFSPELLARASAGKLPSLRVPNALSLEELERAHHSPAVRN